MIPLLLALLVPGSPPSALKPVIQYTLRHLLPDAGLYERLQRRCCWATRGYEAMKSLGRRVPTATLDSSVDALEVRLFDEAVAHVVGDHVNGRAPALEEAVRTGLLGPLARLLASGVHHSAVPPRVKGESAAQLVARVFPHAQRTVIPTSIGSRVRQRIERLLKSCDT